ncbi:MAG: ferredoxin [Bacteroidales bacterium]|nr:ferredoxin [Bacteroidales bacterium]
MKVSSWLVKKVWIIEGCIVCGLCESVCPEVFTVGDDNAVVKENVDFPTFENEIKEAARDCPTEVIKYNE